MKKELIIRTLKENKKYIALIVIASIITTGILIPIMVVINKVDLYQKSRDGILIEERFLQHGERIEEGNGTYRLEWGDGFYFDFYGKTGDWYHFHTITWSEFFRTNFHISHYVPEDYTSYGYGSGAVEANYFMSKELLYDGKYTVRIHNNDMEYSGYITVFIIVYDENFTPNCPLVH